MNSFVFALLFFSTKQLAYAADLSDLVRKESVLHNLIQIKYQSEDLEVKCSVGSFGPLDFHFNKDTNSANVVIVRTKAKDGCGEIAEFDVGFDSKTPGVPIAVLRQNFPGKLIVAFLEESSRCSYEEQAFNLKKAGADLLIISSSIPGVDLDHLNPLGAHDFGESYYEHEGGFIHACLVDHAHGLTLKTIAANENVIHATIERPLSTVFFESIKPGLKDGDFFSPGKQTEISWKSRNEYTGPVTIELVRRGNENEVFEIIASDFAPPKPVKLRHGESIHDIEGKWFPFIQEDKDIDVIMYWVPSSRQEYEEYEHNNKAEYDPASITPHRIKWTPPEYLLPEVPYTIRITATAPNVQGYVQGESNWPIGYHINRPYISVTEPSIGTTVWTRNSRQTISWDVYRESGTSPLDLTKARALVPQVYINLVRYVDGIDQDVAQYSYPILNEFNNDLIDNQLELSFNVMNDIPVGEYLIKIENAESRAKDFAESTRINIVNHLLEVDSFNVPNEEVEQGSAVELLWNYVGNVRKLNIYLQKKTANNDYETIASVANGVDVDNGGFRWVVFPSPAQGYRIMIEDSKKEQQAYSQYDFSVIPNSSENQGRENSDRALIITFSCILVATLCTIGFFYLRFTRKGETADDQSTVPGAEAREGGRIRRLLKKTPSLEELLPNGIFKGKEQSQQNELTPI